MKIKKIVILSRESDSPSLDISLLAAELSKREDTKVVVLCKMLKHNYFSYMLHILRQMREIRSSDVVVLDTYCIPVSLFRHREDQTVIQMWHALSAVKKFGWQTVGKSGGRSDRIARIMKMHAGYDQIICASDVTAKHFCEAFRSSPEKIVKLGLPRIDYILSDKTREKEAIINKYPELSNGKKNILYVPTFRKGVPVNTAGIIDAVDFNKYNLIIKLHPLDALWSGQNESEYEKSDLSLQTRQSEKTVIYDKEFDSYDMLGIADAVISDYSSFVVEATLVDKPLYLYIYDRKEYERSVGLNVCFSNEEIGKYAFENAAELAMALNQPYDYEALHAFRNKYIDIDIKNCTYRLANHIIESIEKK